MASEVTVWIDGKEIHTEEGTSMLEVALTNGIYIPHLCHHPDLPELGSCRLCLVQEEGCSDLVPSCTEKAREGLRIITRSDDITQSRNLAMELILAAHPEDCSTCPKYGRCELQTLIQYMGVSAMRMRTRTKGFARNDKNPLYIHDMTRCILCGRCVRACRDLRGVGILRYNKDELETYIGTLQDRLLKDSDCRFCGACAEVCPTGTIRDLLNFNPSDKQATLIPCKNACPVHTDIPRYIRYAKEGRYAEATAVIHEKLPFPETLGRICSHACEDVCRRGDVNEAVSIRNIKRYVAEHTDNTLWQKNSLQKPRTGKKICVIGAGPAGMTAAYYLGKQGHSVTLKEALPKPGGQLQYGIPSYRLPRDVVDREASYLAMTDVVIETGCRVTDPRALLSEYDAVLLAVGTHGGTRLPIEGKDLDGVMVSTDFLRNCSMGKDTGIGKHIMILGGGNVAFDCARSAIRLGAESVSMAIRKKLETVTGDREELEQAMEEGVTIYPERTYEEICGDGHVEGVRFCRIASYTFDDKGKAVIIKEDDSDHIIPCDTVIFAVGQRTDLPEVPGLERGRANSIAVKGSSLETSLAGIFACGDAVYGTKTVIKAVASGREAASEIDIFLGGDGDISEILLPTELPQARIGRIEGFGYQERAAEEFASADERRSSFAPVSFGICDEKLCGESARCLQCDLRMNISSSRLWTEYSQEGGSVHA